MWRSRFLLLAFLLVYSLPPAHFHSPAAAQNRPAGLVTSLCPAAMIQPRPQTFEPGGIILTAFDRANIWVYNIAQNSRYPLPETAPCTANCHLSYDAQWFTYLNTRDRVFSKMRLDGTQRTPLARGAVEVSWWSADTLLIWTPEHTAYLRPENGAEQVELDVTGVISIQPGGLWALALVQEGEDFTRFMVNLENRDLAWMALERVALGVDARYFNAAAWSPDGAWLAFVMPVFDGETAISGDLYGVRPGDTTPTTWTDFEATYGLVRINGHAPGRLSWSPDGRLLAFWVIPLNGPDPAADGGEAVLHVLDTTTGDITAYCAYTTREHTPNPPRLVWSPDSSHIAFGAMGADPTRGYLLLTLNVETGIYTELSAGIYPALGSADVIAWGQLP